MREWREGKACAQETARNATRPHYRDFGNWLSQLNVDAVHLVDWGCEKNCNWFCTYENAMERRSKLQHVVK